jgi:hypothetical protein
MANIQLTANGQYLFNGVTFATRLEAEQAAQVLMFVQSIRNGVTQIGQGFAALTTAAQIYADRGYYPGGAAPLTDELTGLGGVHAADINSGVATLQLLTSPAQAELYTGLLKLISALRNDV